ncbi:hypothetical protein DICA3_D03510 [Diutina catenulata]
MQLPTTNHTFKFQKFEAADKVIFNLYIDGGMDSTFFVPITAKSVLALDSGLYDEASVDPQLLIGDHSNLKAQIVAGEIAKMVIKILRKPVVVSFGSKWFGRDITSNDFEKLMWTLSEVRKECGAMCE